MRSPSIVFSLLLFCTAFGGSIILAEPALGLQAASPPPPPPPPPPPQHGSGDPIPVGVAPPDVGYDVFDSASPAGEEDSDVVIGAERDPKDKNDKAKCRDAKSPDPDGKNEARPD